jgi:hypothetical protein
MILLFAFCAMLWTAYYRNGCCCGGSGSQSSVSKSSQSIASASVSSQSQLSASQASASQPSVGSVSTQSVSQQSVSTQVCLGPQVCGTLTVPGTQPNNCKLCSDSTPATWTWSISGATLDFAVFNGTWTATYIGSCEWTVTIGSVTGIVTISNHGTFEVQMHSGPTELIYVAFPGGHATCCDARTASQTFSAGAGTFPVDVTATPSNCQTFGPVASGICFTLGADGSYHGTITVNGVSYAATINGNGPPWVLTIGGQQVASDSSSTCQTALFFNVIIGGVAYTLEIDNNGACCGSQSSSVSSLSVSSVSQSVASPSSASQPSSGSQPSSSAASSAMQITACCPNGVPSNLYCTLLAVASCSCVAGSYLITYTGNAFGQGLTGWAFSGTACGGNNLFILLQCDSTFGNVWRLSVSCGPGIYGSASNSNPTNFSDVTSKCGPPIDLTWTPFNGLAGVCCGNVMENFNATVTP